jgi:hypothetical protein
MANRTGKKSGTAPAAVAVQSAGACAVNMPKALDRVKRDIGTLLPAEQAEAAFRESGHVWRERKFGPVATLHLFLVQVLSFNTAITALRHLSGAPVNAASYCRARARLPLAPLQSLLRRSAAAIREAVEAREAGKRGKRGARGVAAAPSEASASSAPSALSAPLWRGLRALLVDGSSTITPDTPSLQKAFGQSVSQAEGCGFPAARLLGVFDAFTGAVVEMLTGTVYASEMGMVGMVGGVHALLGAGDLLVGDRGFCSFAHLALLCVAQVKGLFRMHQKQIVSFRPHRRAKGQKCRKGRGGQGGRGGRGRRKGNATAAEAKAEKRKGEKGLPTSRFFKRLGRHDQLVWWVRPKQRPKWMTEERYDELPGAVLVREIRYRIAAKGQRTRCVTVATTLLDPLLYPKEAIAELYGVRWTAETHFAELKTTLGMRKVKCQTPDGVRKELVVFCLVYNLIHHTMCTAAALLKVDPSRISFIDTVRFLLSAAPGEPMPKLVVNPLRPGRHEPRVIKDRQDSFNVMTKPRKELRKQLKRQKVNA